MNANPLYDELDTNLVENRLDEESTDVLRERIAGRVSPDAIRAAYISTGPTPASPDTVLDVFLLTDAFIYNYELSTQGDEQWFTLPLTSISYIVENLSPQDDRFWSVLIGIRSRAGEHGLALQDNITHKDKMREFADACRDKLSALIVRGELNARELEVQEHLGVN